MKEARISGGTVDFARNDVSRRTSLMFLAVFAPAFKAPLFRPTREVSHGSLGCVSRGSNHACRLNRTNRRNRKRRHG